MDARQNVVDCKYKQLLVYVIKLLDKNIIFFCFICVNFYAIRRKTREIGWVNTSGTT